MSKPELKTSFVISPFGEPFDTYFSHIIKPALEDCGLFAVRGDSLYRPTTIVDDIWQGIRDADLLVAELTDRNPNVFYELGLAHAISKPVILISKSIEDVPFDLRSIRVLLYDKDHPDWGNKLRAALTKAIQEVMTNPLSAIPTTFKSPIKTNAPEESETLLRLETLESLVHRIADSGGATYKDGDVLNDGQGVKPFSPKFKAGQEVYHQRFGTGKILRIEGGKNPRAQVNFDHAGMKVLDMAIAKMEALS
ncbi:hypothetical protein [Rugamonas apoptosis]|uniref:Nucleoside 2-deoxyribosyltransferase n=1 Tax=Rugamonas apoptosis TaxID=2758570 RepID=A0A7W2FCW8_9BURK|nr:hypothetical protein [Rugamonas apoptosis]MBA5689398.1 hypothetical protein [Rugamonas apoptosis]